MLLIRGLVAILSLIILPTCFAQDIEFVVQTGHASGVSFAQFSNSGKLLATSGEDNNVVLWEVESGRQLRLLNGHTAIVNEVNFLPGDSLLLSCSDDKRVVLWNVNTGALEKEWSLEKSVKSIAIDPEIENIYCAAGNLIKLPFNEGNSSLFWRLKKHPFSKVHIGKSGVILFGSEKEKFFYQVKDSVLNKGTGSVRAMVISADEESLFISSKNGHVNEFHWSEDEYKFARTVIPTGLKSNASRSLTLANGNLLQLKRNGGIVSYNYKTKAINGYFKGHDYGASAIDFHPDGNLFVSVGLDGKIFLWDHEYGGMIREFTSFSSQINFAKFADDNRTLILGYNDGLIRVWDLGYGGFLETKKLELTRDKIRKGWQYHVTELTSQDSTALKFRVVLSRKYKGGTSFKECRYFDFSWNTATGKTAFIEKFIENFDKGAMSEVDLISSENLVYEDSTQLAKGDGKKVFLTKKASGKVLELDVAHTTPITTIDYNDSLNLFVTSAWDGQIWLYDNEMKPKARLVSINDQDYVIINNDNYYYATKGALSSVSFAVEDKAVSFAQFDMYFNRPDIVYGDLPFGDSALVSNFQRLYKKRISRLDLEEGQVKLNDNMPTVEIEYDNQAITKESTVGLTVLANDLKELQTLHILIDGVPLFGSEGAKINGKSYKGQYSIPLRPGINEIEVHVENSSLVGSLRKTLLVKSDIKQKTPNLYFIGIGASNYADTNFNLSYAAKDIEDVTKMIKKSKAFDDVFSVTLTDRQISMDSLDRIEDLLENATVNDAVILYYAGHGVLNSNFDYYLGSYDMDFTKPEEAGIPYDEIEGMLMACESRRKLIFLDACHSGELDKENLIETEVIEGTDVQFRAAGLSVGSKDQSNAMEQAKMLFADLKANTGITVISSAGGTEYAIESDKWQNGVFTYSLIHGLKDKKSGLDNKGPVTVFDLLKYLKKEVNTLSNGAQQPTYRSENIQNNFVIWK